MNCQKFCHYSLTILLTVLFISYSIILPIAYTPVFSHKLEKLNYLNRTLEEKNPSNPSTSALANPLNYNRIAAKGYANKWWNGRNIHYNDFSASGGDCANFVSQCLIAGGLSLHNGTNGVGYGVYPDRDRPSTYSNGTIPYCDYLNLHLRNYQDTSITYVTNTAPSIPTEITIGDIVIFGNKSGDKYQHAMVVVWDGGTEIGLAAHSSNVWNRTFTVELSYFSCATFYHIEDGIGEFYHFKINTGSLNVRVGPGLNNLSNNYQDIGDLHSGEEYIAFGKEKDESGKIWWHFWFDDRAAWCALWYTVNVTGNKVIETVVSDYLNVRSGPGTSYAIYGQIYDNMRFVSDRMDNGWYRYWYGGAQKYSSGSYFNELNPYIINNFTKPIIGFLPYWVSKNQNYTVISHLAWFSIELTSNGTVSNAHGWPDWTVINAVHSAGNKIILTATMFSSTNIHTLLTSYKQTAVNTLLAQVQAGNADGISIDFENPKQAGDDVLLVQFMNMLYTTFKTARNDYHISLCTPSVDWWDTYDYASLNSYVDTFMLMGYGYYYSGSSNAGPTSPLEGPGYDINWSVNYHLSNGVSKSKLVLGLPFYGFDWPVVDQTKQSTARSSGSSVTYSVALSLVSTYSPIVYYDDIFECAWFNYDAGGSDWHQVWFDNYTSLEAKFDYINDRDLGGLGIWAYGYQGTHKELEDLILDKFIFKSEQHPPGSFVLTSDAENNDPDGEFYLNWTLSQGATSYSVYRSSSQILVPGSGTVVVSDLLVNSTEILNMISGSYYFAVVAYNESGSTLSNNVEITVLRDVQLTTNAGNPDRDGNFELSWNSSLGYDNFSLYLYNFPITEINSSLVPIEGHLTNNSYLILNVPDDTFRYYILVAHSITGNTSSNYLRIAVMFGLPGEFILLTSAGSPDPVGSFYLVWSSSDGAENYSVYESNAPITEFNQPLIELVANFTNTMFYISNLPNGTYYFIVVAHNSFGNSTSNCLTVVVALPPTQSNDDNDDTSEDKKSSENILLSFITSPIGFVTVGTLVGFTIGISLAIKRKIFHRSSRRERRKLEKISANARKNS